MALCEGVGPGGRITGGLLVGTVLGLGDDVRLGCAEGVRRVLGTPDGVPTITGCRRVGVGVGVSAGSTPAFLSSLSCLIC
ncbi:MAG: hypothetical protein QOG99_2093, partial [Frankiales bacterium]|nr:hypothetical protein [Frankiales bacterium]